MQHVEDKDLGFRDMVRAAAKVDGLELRNGILDHTLRYPKSANAKGQTISRVAMINRIYEAISAGYDAQAGTIDAVTAKLLRYVHEGGDLPAEFIQRELGIKIQASQRAALSNIVRKRTGRMWKAIRSTVFEEGRITGARGARSGARGKVAAGDDPKRPKPTESV